jgi:pimeloyl-ACP methyl ester carboxylesterase
LAEALLEPRQPLLVALGGFSGSGKSTLSAHLASALGPAPGARILATDRIRKALHGVAPTDRLPPEAYAPQVSARVYAMEREACAATLRAGGIERYLEAFPDGGFFQGRNFVFDERQQVAPAAASRGCSPVGRCLRCSAAWDSYAAGRRCGLCRMLVLLCDGCAQGGGGAAAPEVAGPEGLVCEICTQRAQQDRAGGPLQGLLRVLCLHGFRQTGSNFRGRTAALRKRLKGVVDLVFMDGPLALPALTKGASDEEVLQARPRRAWMVAPEQYAAMRDPAAGATPGLVMDEHQHSRQTAGWAESAAALEEALSELGPFDGVLGFSQGAAAAAVLCAQRPTAFGFAILCSGYVPAAAEHSALLQAARDAGGVPLPSLHVYNGQEQRPGAGGEERLGDRQVALRESQELAECFDPRRRAVLRHAGGHVVPSSRAAAQRIKDFMLAVTECRV